jgi:hypothetical protein
MDKSFFSNYGEFVDVAAPGGGDVGVMSTHNNGTRSPGGEDYIQMKGTSMAAPHVAGVAALMLGTNPDLSPAQVRQLIIDSAREFTNESNCTDSICGAGLLDAEGAVLMAISTPGDPDFVFNEPLLGSSSEPVTITWFNQFDEEGGGCGTVDMNSGGPGGPFNMSLLLGFFMALVFSNFRIYKTR